MTADNKIGESAENKFRILFLLVFRTFSTCISIARTTDYNYTTAMSVTVGLIFYIPPALYCCWQMWIVDGVQCRRIPSFVSHFASDVCGQMVLNHIL